MGMLRRRLMGFDVTAKGKDYTWVDGIMDGIHDMGREVMIMDRKR